MRKAINRQKILRNFIFTFTLVTLALTYIYMGYFLFHLFSNLLFIVSYHYLLETNHLEFNRG
jgi:hypothetical protein